MTYASEVAADSPVLWWRLNESSGTTANDSSAGGTHDGTYAGSPTLGATGLITDGTTAVTFDGTDDRVNYSGTVLSSAAGSSVEVWIKAPTPAGNQIIYWCTGSSSAFYATAFTDGTVQVVVNPTSTGQIVINSIPGLLDNATHHLVVTYEDSTDTATVYIDGSSYTTGSVTGSGKVINVNAVHLGGNDSTSYFPGVLDEFAIYNTALSSTRVGVHYSEGTASAADHNVTLTGEIPAVESSINLEVSGTGDLSIYADGEIGPVVGQVFFSPSRQVSFSGEVGPVVGAVTLDLVGSTSVRAAGSVPAVVGSLTLGAGSEVQVNRVGSWVRDNIGEALWTPAVVAPTGTQPQHRVVAQAYTAPTIDGTHLTLEPDTLEATAHRDRIVVGGKDITYWRDVPTPTPDFQWVQPLGYGAATLDIPQAVVPFETPGVGDLAWLRKGALVLIQRVDADTGEFVRTDWRGFVVTYDVSGGRLRVELGGEATGRAALQDRQMRLIQLRPDAGALVGRAMRALRLRHVPSRGTTTGIDLISWGGGGQLDYINELVSKMTTTAGDQWTVMPDDNGVYTTTLRDLDTIHGTVYLDDARVKGDLRSDLAEEPNRVFASGVTPGGMVVKFGAYPGLVQAEAAPYPFNDNSSFGIGTTDGDTDTGDGITVMGWKLRSAGFLESRDTYGDYDDEMGEAIVALKKRANLKPYTTSMTPNAWKALYDLSATGYTLRNIRVLPAATNDDVDPWRLSSNGSIIARNPDYDPTVIPVDRTIQMGAGFTRRQIRQWATKELAATASWRGTIEINTGAIVAGNHTPGTPIGSILRARDIRPGMNLSLPLFAGGIVVHVAGVSVTDNGRLVTLAVDTKPGDTLPVWAAIQRDRENRDTVHRSFMRQHKASRLERENTFDEVGGIVQPIELDAGWNVFPVVAKQAGTIEKIRVNLDPNREFAMAVFGRRIRRRVLRAVTNDPLSAAGSRRWTSETWYNRLDSKYVMLYVAGSEDDPCGYSPGRKSEGDSLTGKFVDDASFPFVTYHNETDRGSVLWVAVWVPSATTLRGGRIMWPSSEDY